MTNDFNTLSRRGAMKCLGWAGTGALFTLMSGVASSLTLEQALAAPAHKGKALRFLQISDTHVGFSKPANPDPVATLKETIAKVKALPDAPDFIVHTGDITHLAKPEQFDLAEQLLREFGLPIHFVPGEHDIVDGVDPRPYLSRFGKKTATTGGWYSFDIAGTHIIGLVNVVTLGDQGMGTLGTEQLAWLKKDLAGQKASTPIVLLSHFPLWPVYPSWGWGTQDGAAALALLSRFASVTSLNGHIHQIQTMVEGHVRFHAARSTAYPQPAPGVGAGPGPLLVPPEQLRGVIGYSSLEIVTHDTPIAVTDTALG